MSAALLAITEEQQTPSARQDRLLRKVQDARARLMVEFDGYEDTKALKAAFEEYESAESRRYLYWEQRAQRAERRLRDILCADLSDGQRAGIMEALHGPVEGRRRNARLLTPYERETLDYYRRIDAKGRMMLRELCERLAATSEPERAE